MLTYSALSKTSLKLLLGKTTLIVFPEKGSKPEADLVLYPKPDEEPPKGTISWPGEYDIGGVSVIGLGHGEGGQISYVITEEDVRTLILSSPLQLLSDIDLQQVGDIDILCIPTDDLKKVQTLIDAIDPRVLIPLETDAKAYPEVLKAVGAVGREAVEEYKIKGALPVEGREVVILKMGK